MTLMPEVRDELYAAAERAARDPSATGRRRVRWARRPAGALSVGLSVICTLAVCAGAFVLLGHSDARHQPNGASATMPAPHHGQRGATATRSPRAVSLAELRSKLAIVRRPQTAADRTLPQWALGGPSGARPVASLSRLATTVPTPTVGPVAVYVLVFRQRLGGMPDYSPVVVAVTTHGPHRVSFTGGALMSNPAVVTTGMQGPSLPAAPRSVAIGPEGSIDPMVGVSVGLAPDGVSRVVWRFTGAGIGTAHPRPTTPQVTVASNVAVAAITPHQGPLERASWYGPSGALIKTAVQRGADDTIRAVNASRHRPVAPTLREHFALFTQTAPDNPGRDYEMPIQTTGPRIDVNYFQTRAVRVGSQTAWITPGLHDLCLSNTEGGTCGPLSGSLTNAGVIGGTTSVTGRPLLFTALVPNGNPTVTLLLADGQRQTVAVTAHNVVLATVKARVTAIIDRGLDGRLGEQKV